MDKITQPNVIVFFTDQQRWDSTGFHGNPMNLTPNFDRFAMEGTHCYNAFTCQPVCVPARLALQTGKYPSSLNSFNNAQGIEPGEKNLGSYFKEAGYQTAYIGKWHLAKSEPVPPEYRTGYDYWLASNVLEFTSDSYNTTVYDNNGNPVFLPGYRVDALTDAAIGYVNEHKENPFFLFCSYVEPHFQNSRDDYPAPIGYEEKYLDCWTPPDLKALNGSSAGHLPGYYGMIKRLDEAFGRLQDALISMNLDKNTIIIFTSDHGCHFKTRNDEYKRSCHDSSIRIPMAISGPGFNSGGRLKEMISLIDIPPTLLDACNIKIPTEMQGRSILPLTSKRDPDWPKEIYSEIFETYLSRCVRTKRWKYSIRRNEKGFENRKNWDFTEEYLYDLKADPYELNNLIGYTSHREVADVLKECLIKRMQEAGEPKPVISNAPQIEGGQKTLNESEKFE